MGSGRADLLDFDFEDLDDLDDLLLEDDLLDDDDLLELDLLLEPLELDFNLLLLDDGWFCLRSAHALSNPS